MTSGYASSINFRRSRFRRTAHRGPFKLRCKNNQSSYRKRLDRWLTWTNRGGAYRIFLFGGHIVLYKLWLAGNRIARSSRAKSATRCFLGQKTGKSVRCTLKSGIRTRYNSDEGGNSFGKRPFSRRNLPSQQRLNIIYKS